MGEIREWFYSVMLISLFSGALTMISPEKTGKGVKYLTSICLVGVLLSPLTSLVGVKPKFSFSFDEEKTLTGESLLIEETTENIKKEVSALIAKKYGISENSFGVELEIDEGNLGAVEIEKVIILSDDKGVLHHGAEIEKYISGEIICGCEVRKRDG